MLLAHHVSLKAGFLWCILTGLVNHLCMCSLAFLVPVMTHPEYPLKKSLWLHLRSSWLWVNMHSDLCSCSCACWNSLVELLFLPWSNMSSHTLHRDLQATRTSPYHSNQECYTLARAVRILTLILSGLEPYLLLLSVPKVRNSLLWFHS